jgi:hypothetical protein
VLSGILNVAFCNFYRLLTLLKTVSTLQRIHLGIKLSKMNWLLGRKSKLSIINKLLVYEVILKPIWTYGIQLWGSASISNIEILERSQGKVLRTITHAPRYLPNTVLRQDLQITSVKRKSADSAANTGPSSTHIPTTSRYHQTTGDSHDVCAPDFFCKCSSVTCSRTQTMEFSKSSYKSRPCL